MTRTKSCLIYFQHLFVSHKAAVDRNSARIVLYQRNGRHVTAASHSLRRRRHVISAVYPARRSIRYVQDIGLYVSVSLAERCFTDGRMNASITGVHHDDMYVI